VKWDKVNATIPKGTDPQALTLDEALVLIEERAAAKGVKVTKPKAKAPAKPKAAAKAKAPAKPKAAPKKKPAAAKPAAKSVSVKD
jgi:DNA topoisomerase-1